MAVAVADINSLHNKVNLYSKVKQPSPDKDDESKLKQDKGDESQQPLLFAEVITANLKV